MSSINKLLGEIKTFEPSDPLAKHYPLVVYGAGGYGRDLVRALHQRGHTILGFLDCNGLNEVDGIPCRSPKAELNDWLKWDPTVLLGLHNQRIDLLQIRVDLFALGFRRVHLPVEFHPVLEKQLGVRYWLGNRTVYSRHTDELETLFVLLSDEKSRELLLSTLAYRALGRPEAYPAVHPGLAYFAQDLPRWSDSLNWVDGGACDGDSLLSFPTDQYQCGQVYAFEPDLTNFEKLQGAIKQFRRHNPLSLIYSWPCGLGGENIQLKFKTGLGLGSAAAPDGESYCPIVQLDSALAHSPVNLIKLDVEGAEPSALLGAEQIIREQKPGLAVCIYHTPEHLWEIPLELARRHAGYDFYLRNHGQGSFDLVLYAIANSRAPAP